jgi:adenine phosphoribosyltransferase
VGIGVILTEAHDWKSTLGPDATLVHGLAHIPQFSPVVGVWKAIPETE